MRSTLFRLLRRRLTRRTRPAVTVTLLPRARRDPARPRTTPATATRIPTPQPDADELRVRAWLHHRVG
jgi:hypothetical protein